MKKLLFLINCLAVGILPSCSQNKQSEGMSETNKDNNSFEKVVKTDEEWKQELDPETYYITRQKGTERAFTGKYYKFDEKGVYHCSNCLNPLFTSDSKFESGSGWPSFYTVYSENSVEEIRDVSFGMVRTEVICKRCGAHLGHVFDDGPKPTGMRYCVNSPSLEFEKAKEEEEK